MSRPSVAGVLASQDYWIESIRNRLVVDARRLAADYAALATALESSSDHQGRDPNISAAVAVERDLATLRAHVNARRQSAMIASLAASEGGAS